MADWAVDPRLALALAAPLAAFRNRCTAAKLMYLDL
jgi:hypothetical protein